MIVARTVLEEELLELLELDELKEVEPTELKNTTLLNLSSWIRARQIASPLMLKSTVLVCVWRASISLRNP
jgi:hypothetical protein